MKPADVTVFNAQDAWRTLYGKKTPSKKYKFNVGDQVKISKYKKVFEKRIPAVLDRRNLYNCTEVTTKSTRVSPEGGKR